MTSVTKGTLINCLCGRIVELPCRAVRAVRLAYHPARTINQCSPKDAGSPCESGITLLELILVLVIIALVLGVSYPSMSRGSSILNLNTASRDVLNTFRFARERAITEQTTMLLVIDRNGRKLELANVLGEPMRAYTLPDGINIQRMTRAGNEVKDDVMIVRFTPNGNLENVSIRLAANKGVSRMQIVSDPLFGGARVEPIREDLR